MKKLTALIITLVFALTMVMAVPAQAATAIPEDGIVSATTSNSGLVTDGSKNATRTALTNGKYVYVPFDVPEGQSGTYKITVNHASWDTTSGYKVFVNEIPQGVVSFGTASSVELGSYELLDGTNAVRLYAVEAPSSIWVYSIKVERTGDLKGDMISVPKGNSRVSVTEWNSSYSYMKAAGTFSCDMYVPEANNYEVYFVGGGRSDKTNSVTLKYKNGDGEEQTAVTGVALPAHNSYGSMDMTYIGNVPLVEGNNTISIYLHNNSGAGTKAASIMIKKIVETQGDLTNVTTGSYGKMPKGTKLVTMTIPKKGKYAIIADVASYGTNEHTLSLYKYSETANWNIGSLIGTTAVQSPDVDSNGYGTWLNETVLAVGEFDTTDTSFWIDNNIAGFGIRNLKLVDAKSLVPQTKLYLGTEATATKEITILRSGTVTVQTTLSDESQDAVMIAVLYEDGEIKDVNTATEKNGTTLTCTLDTTKATNIAASYVKVFAWDSFDMLTPLTMALER